MKLRRKTKTGESKKPLYMTMLYMGAGDINEEPGAMGDTAFFCSLVVYSGDGGGISSLIFVIS
jgi:hypothetical protein